MPPSVKCSRFTRMYIEITKYVEVNPLINSRVVITLKLLFGLSKIAKI